MKSLDQQVRELKDLRSNLENKTVTEVKTFKFTIVALPSQEEKQRKIDAEKAARRAYFAKKAAQPLTQKLGSKLKNIKLAA